MTPSLTVNRRHFLQQATLALALPFPAVLRGNAPSMKQLQPIRTISHLNHRYHGWSTLARRRNGQLVLAYSGGRQAHVCPFGRVEFMKSSDDGNTWSWPQIIHDGPIDDRDAGILETARGTLLATTFTSLAYQPILEKQEANPTWDPKKLAEWQAAHNRLSDSERPHRLAQLIQRSIDGGATWSAPYSSIVNSPHGPIQLSDDRLLYAGKELWTGGKRVGVCQSTDDGKTWSWLAEIPTRPGDNPADYHELHAVETSSGRLLVQIRNHNPSHQRETLQCESQDGGRTWSQPRSIGVWGLPSHLLRLRDGRLLMSYGYRRRPFGNQARLSTDQGKSWSDPITISEDGASGDLGYPSTVEVQDGSLVSVWYEKREGNPHAVLRQAHWRLDE